MGQGLRNFWWGCANRSIVAQRFVARQAELPRPKPHQELGLLDPPYLLRPPPLRPAAVRASSVGCIRSRKNCGQSPIQKIITTSGVRVRISRSERSLTGDADAVAGTAAAPWWSCARFAQRAEEDPSIQPQHVPGPQHHAGKAPARR